jgi:heme exporter protein CcmD
MNSAFSDLQTFWQMGGYAAAVWSAYGIVLLVLVGQFIGAKRKLNHLYKMLYRKYAKSA